jgi:hypothetical protein
MSANVETMFTLRVPAWHGLGLIIEDAPNSADALRIAGLDWQVKMGDAMLQTPDGQLIKTDNLVFGTFLQHIVNEVAPDKTCAACYNYLHYFIAS